MDFIAIAGLVSVVGSAAAVVLVYKLVGFSAPREQVEGRALTIGSGRVESFEAQADVVEQVAKLQALAELLYTEISERAAANEEKWLRMERARDEEVRQLREMVLQLRYELRRGFRDYDESRRSRERELERRIERERELEQSQWLLQKERRPLASAR